MRITAVAIDDYKVLKHIQITPAADAAAILIVGKNKQGKTTVLEALETVFGGAKVIAADPVRHGADAAAIRVELDDGELTIKRRIEKDGKTSLEVRDRIGAVRSPQAMLDKLVGSRTIDPLAFLQLEPKAQRAQLMKLIPNADRIAKLNERRERQFDARTEVGRDRDKATAALALLESAKAPVGTAIDVAALAAEQRTFAEQQRAGDAAGNVAAIAERDAAAARAEVAKIEARIRELADQLMTAKAASEAAIARVVTANAKVQETGAAWTAMAARRAQVDSELARAGEHNRTIAAAEAQAKRRAEVKAEAEKLAADYAAATELLAQIDVRKAEILGAAPPLVDGLEVTDDGLTLAGVPFAQASAAERMRTAIAIACASSPGLDDIWVRDGALLDDEMREAIIQHAKAAGKRLWIELITATEPGVIVIHDGEVREQAKGAA